MRMWMVDPRFMCHFHVLGEHRELHSLAGMLVIPRMNGIIRAYLKWGMLEVENLASRHDELVKDFARRGWPAGFEHQTPFQLDRIAPQVVEKWSVGHVHRRYSLLELLRRCPKCRKEHDEVASVIAEQLLKEVGVTPVGHKSQEFMISWTNETPENGPFELSDSLRES